MLTLNVQCRGGEKDGTCTCGSGIQNLKVKKETDIDGVTNFTKYIHKLRNSGGRTFTLNRTLEGGGKIGVTTESDTKIQNVTEVAVYY